MRWCGGHCDGSKGTRALLPSWFTLTMVSPFGSNAVTTPPLMPRRFAYANFFGEYCYLKQRKFEVRTGSDVFGQVRQNPTIFEPRTAPGVRSGPLPMSEPELRFGSGSAQVWNLFWTGQWQHYFQCLSHYSCLSRPIAVFEKITPSHFLWTHAYLPLRIHYPGWTVHFEGPVHFIRISFFLLPMAERCIHVDVMQAVCYESVTSVCAFLHSIWRFWFLYTIGISKHKIKASIMLCGLGFGLAWLYWVQSQVWQLFCAWNEAYMFPSIAWAVVVYFHQCASTFWVRILLT
jgi:hypothetical protein